MRLTEGIHGQGPLARNDVLGRLHRRADDEMDWALGDFEPSALAAEVIETTWAILAGLLDEIVVHIAPVLLGDAVFFGGPGLGRVGLERTALAESGQLTDLRFRVVKEGGPPTRLAYEPGGYVRPRTTRRRSTR